VEDFFAFCQANRDFRIERDKDGNILIIAPTGSETGKYNTDILTELNLWNRTHKLGFVFDSSTGFRLPNGAVRSPDASWMQREKWEALTDQQRKEFAPLCPDFLVELRSESDSMERLKKKMQEYIANGCRLGWLIDRVAHHVFIYRADGSIGLVKSFDERVSGESVLPGFELPLSLLK
jgi:Uma2 family endonuclease